MNIMDLLQSISDTLTPVGVVTCVVLLAFKWRQVSRNTDTIKNMRKHCAKTSGEINKKLGKIGREVSAIHGYILGKNGKDL